MHRRAFITGLVSFVTAPAIVRAASLMPVKVKKRIIIPHDMYEQLPEVLQRAMFNGQFKGMKRVSDGWLFSLRGYPDSRIFFRDPTKRIDYERLPR